MHFEPLFSKSEKASKGYLVLNIFILSSEEKKITPIKTSNAHALKHIQVNRPHL